MVRSSPFDLNRSQTGLRLIMRRILYIVPYVPNLIRTRPYNLIRALSDLGHEVTVATLIGSKADEIDAAVLHNHATQVLALPLTRSRSLTNSLSALLTDEPIQAAYCWQPALAGRLRRLLMEEEFDVVHVEHLRGARYGLLAKSVIATAGLPTPIVWDSVDSISHLFRQASVGSIGRVSRWIARLELPRTERYEGRMIAEFDAVLASSPVDQDALIRLAAAHHVGDPSVHVLPNGVDLDAFTPIPSSERDPATLIVSGKMSYHANVAMAVGLVREIMPVVWAARPDVRLEIVGKDPTAEVQSLAADPRVIVTGEVPQIQAYLQRATIAVAPIVYGAGIQNKILEAMACATPVVTTPLALQGIAAEPGRHLLVAGGDHGMAAAVIRLLGDPALRTGIGRAGRSFVERNHNWQTIAGQLAQLYERLSIQRFALATN